MNPTAAVEINTHEERFRSSPSEPEADLQRDLEMRHGAVLDVAASFHHLEPFGLRTVSFARAMAVRITASLLSVDEPTISVTRYTLLLMAFPSCQIRRTNSCASAPSLARRRSPRAVTALPNLLVVKPSESPLDRSAYAPEPPTP